MIITEEKIIAFKKWLEKKEKGRATAEKYAREVRFSRGGFPGAR